MFCDLISRRGLLRWKIKYSSVLFKHLSSFPKSITRKQLSLFFLGVFVVVHLVWAFAPWIILELPLDLKNLPFSLYQFKLNSFLNGQQKALFLLTTHLNFKLTIFEILNSLIYISITQDHLKILGSFSFYQKSKRDPV